MEDQIRAREEELRLAMLSGDVGVLDSLIAQQLLFVGPAGDVFSKTDDLNLHRSGRQRLAKADWLSIDIAMHGQSAVAVVRADLAGQFDGVDLHGLFRYCRFWVLSDGVWKVVGGSVVPLPPRQ